MRPAPTELVNFLASNSKFKFADCFTFTLLDGTKLYYTTAQGNIYVIPVGESDPVTFLAGQLLVRGLRFRARIGTEVDEQDVTLHCKTSFTLGGIPFMQAVRAGALDGATIKRDRFFMQDWGDAPVGGVTLFAGRVASVDNIGILACSVKVKSDLILLNSPLPHNVYQPACLNTLFDGVCSLLKSSFAEHGSVEAASTKAVINWASATAGYFDLGTILFENGANVGVRKTIRRSTGSTLILVSPLEFTPAEDDDFVAYPGCDKTQSTCLNTFNNLANFRGFPFVPQPETAI